MRLKYSGIALLIGAALMGAVAFAAPRPGKPGKPTTAPAPAPTVSAGAVIEGTGAPYADLLTNRTEAAIDAALRYLQKSQKADGSWENAHEHGNAVGVTGFCLIAYMVQGHFPGEKPYDETMKRGLDFLLKESKSSPNGYMGTSMYSHGLATLALSELWGQTDRDDEIRDALKLAVDVILRAQSPLGGWRYNPEPVDQDVSVTVMQLVALASARQAGILVPDQTVERAIRYVKMCHDEATGGFHYTGVVGEPGFPRSAAAVVSLMMCGKHDAPETKSGLDYLEHEPAAKFQHTPYYPYAMYYGALSMYLAGDKRFRAWYPQIRDVYVSGQRPEGCWGYGDNYGTALAAIVLGLPYSYVPAYQR